MLCEDFLQNQRRNRDCQQVKEYEYVVNRLNFQEMLNRSTQKEIIYI